MKSLSIYMLGALMGLFLPAQGQSFTTEINEPLQQTTRELISQAHLISPERKEKLVELADYLLEQKNDSVHFNALFVCTHNSRRSHITDTWFQYALIYYGISGYNSFSGGLEATAFHPNAIAALQRAGFSVAFDKKVTNPVVSVSPGHYPVWHKQSKIYTHPVNPKSNFVAVMVCSDADQSCPVVDGASARFSLPYDDPRYFDNTPSQDLKYDETVELIGREILFMIGYLKNQLIISEESRK
jgi:hypothetical protein